MDLQLGRDSTVGPTGAFWSDEGLARLAAAGVQFSLDQMPQVHRYLSGEALDAFHTAMAASRPDVASFAVPAGVAATLRKGEHFDRSGCSWCWSQAGLAALRAAGWDGSLRTEPLVEDVIGRIASAIPRPAAPAPIAPATAASPRSTPASSALPSRPAPPAAAKPTAPIAALDMKHILARSQHGDVAFAKMAGATAQEDDLAGATSINDFSSRFWSRHRAREAAGMCGRIGKRRDTETEARATVRSEGGAENRLPDAADVLARRRSARSGA